MICFPNAKINVGLNIAQKRSDNYHNINSLFYPIYNLYDVLEIVESPNFSFDLYGLKIEGDTTENLVIKAYNLLKKDFLLPNVSIFLKKNIPMGAGLGGGSSDAAFALVLLKKIFDLPISDTAMEEYCMQLGSDCGFFLKNVPCFVSGRGEELKPSSQYLKSKHILVVKPDIHVSTSEAYASIVPKCWDTPLENIVEKPLLQWRELLFNDFETPVFELHKKLETIKNNMYRLGAEYASMTGSGSAVYGIFRVLPNRFELFGNYYTFSSVL